MILLDENILESQRELLIRQRLRPRQIGVDVAHKGLLDEEIIRLLLRLRRPTFFTRDVGFYRPELCHRRYCLICLAVKPGEAAFFVRRFLREPSFGTHSRRCGTVVRASSAGLRYWKLHEDGEISLPWA